MNLTKIEQILDTKETVYAENADGSGSSCGYEYSGVKEAIKEIAIEFLKWFKQNELLFEGDDDDSFFDWNNHKEIGHSELFDIFNNSENK